MKYKDIELKEFTSDKPVVFDPPKKMLVWDGIMDTPLEAKVYSYMPAWRYPVGTSAQTFCHCAEIPEEPKSRRATNRELARWLAQGNGEKNRLDEYEKEGVVFVSIEFTYESGDANLPVDECYFVRKWDDKEWHEPTADYIGLEDEPMLTNKYN